jgi:DNA-directed RNA polymerase specialized sigma subunit
MSLDQWNLLRKAAEHEPGEIYDNWRSLLDDVSQVRNEILLDYMYLAKTMAYTFAPQNSYLREDFESYAIIILIRSLDTFKLHLQIPFAVHAYTWMLSYLTRMADKQGAVNLSDSGRRLLGRYRDLRASITSAIGRTPKLDEIAERMQIPVEKLENILAMTTPILSIDAEGEDGATLHELLPSKEEVQPRSDLEDLKKGIMKALALLEETGENRGRFLHGNEHQ